MQSKLDAYAIIRKGIGVFIDSPSPKTEMVFDLEVGTGSGVSLIVSILKEDLYALQNEINNILESE